MSPINPRISPMNAVRLAIERNVIYASIGIQAALTFTVVSFCALQLNRCPVAASTTENASPDSGLADVGTCPRALYTNMITAAVAYWFPAPWYAYISNTEAPQPAPRRRTTKVTDEAATVVEESES